MNQPDQPLRIALLTYSSRPRGGVVHTLALAEALARAGQEVTVWTLARGGDTGFFRTIDPAVQQRLVTFPDPPDGQDESVGERVQRSIELLGTAFAGAVASGERFDVVHAQDCISANAISANAISANALSGSVRPNRPVRTVHHIDHFTTPQLAACHERAIREPVAHVCVSASVARELQEGWGITATVIPNGVEAVRFAVAAGDDANSAAQRAQWQQRLGRYVLAVGGIEPRKGTLDLVRAMALVQAQDPGVKLVIAGGETLFDYRDYRREVDALVDELGVRLEMLGPVDHEQLPSLVAAAGVFAFPSTQEGFGLAAMEALAAGVPLVVRDLPVLREVFGDVAGFASDPGKLAQELRSAVGGTSPARVEAGQALAAAHTWDSAASTHLAFYRERIAAGIALGV